MYVLSHGCALTGGQGLYWAYISGCNGCRFLVSAAGAEYGTSMGSILGLVVPLHFDQTQLSCWLV